MILPKVGQLLEELGYDVVLDDYEDENNQKISTLALMW